MPNSLRQPPFLQSAAARRAGAPGSHSERWRPGEGGRRPSPGAPRYLQAEDVLALPQGHGLPQDAGAVGRGRRNAAVLAHAALRAQRQRRLRSPAGTRDGTAAPTDGRNGRGTGVGRGRGIRYQREQLSALSSRPSAARVRAQEGPGGAMGAAVAGWPPGAGRLPERPRSTSRITRRRRCCSEFPARHRCASAEGSAHARSETPRSPPPGCRASRASGAGRGRATRGGATREGRAEEKGGLAAGQPEIQG